MKITNKLLLLRCRLVEKLQNYCDALSPKKRLVSIVVLGSVFGITSLYFSFSGIYCINKTDSEQIKIEHINQLKLHYNDSIQQQNLKQYERQE
jgi:hypothetical protein